MKINNVTIKQHMFPHTKFSDVDLSVQKQIVELMNHTVIDEKTLKFMPDFHISGHTLVGLTGKYINNKTIPEIVGPDIGCGVSCYKLDFDFDFNNENLLLLQKIISKCINTPIFQFPKKFDSYLEEKIKQCCDKIIEINNNNYFKNSISKFIATCGTLGGGNHFIEIEKDKENNTYIVVHSGSRSVGGKIFTFYNSLAKERCLDAGLSFPKGLQYLYLKSDVEEYNSMMNLAISYAELNRIFIIKKIIYFMKKINDNIQIPNTMTLLTKTITSIHNYYDGYYFRKGAIKISENELFLFPLNIKDGIEIRRANKNYKKFNRSAPHGLGRQYSRKEVIKIYNEFPDMYEYDKKELNSNMISNCVLDRDMCDEFPKAYKDYNLIKNYLNSVSVMVNRLRPIFNYKEK